MASLISKRFQQATQGSRGFSSTSFLLARVLFTSILFVSFLIVVPGSSYDASAKSNTNNNAAKPQNLASGGNPVSNYKGHFEGSESDHLAGTFHKRAIHADFDLSQKNPTISVQDFVGNTILNLDFVKTSDKELQIRVSALEGETKRLEKEDACFSDTAHQTLFCFYDDGMDFEATTDDGTPVVTLSLSHFAVEKQLFDETPQSYTLQSAVSRALKMNFDSRIEFEHVIQAKKTAKAAYLNLLPHLSINSVLALVTPNPSSIASVAGDLLPFLLPSRWMLAKKSQAQAQGEAQALTLMHLDTANLVEGLFYSEAHDQDTQNLYKKLLGQASTVRQEIAIRQQMGQYAAGSTDNIDSIINKMTQDYSVYDQIIAEDLASLSQSLGFYSSQAVTGASLDISDENIDQTKAVDVKEVTAEAVARSFELKQLDDLLLAAKENKNQLFFNWLDPVGDPTAELGFNLKANFAVAQSQIRELTLKRSEIQSLLENKVFAACTEYNQALTTYAQAKDGVAIDQRRLDQILNFVQVGQSVDLFHILDVLQDVLNSGVRNINALTAFRVSRSKIDRLLLQGYYAHPDKPTSQPTPPQTNH